MHLRHFVFHPGKQRRPEVEADLRISAHHARYPAIALQNTRRRIGRITFRGDPLIPIVIRPRRVLHLHRFQPCIFARRLIKMTVNTYELFHNYLLSWLLNATAARGGTVMNKLYGRSCHPKGAALTAPKFPCPLPPYSLASVLIASRHSPARGIPI